ncbi:MAG TPA: ABC transporter permease [Acidimicrobiales bacterium]|jgi:simple sugar transport system permease protein
MKSRIFYALAAPVIAAVLAIVVSSIALLIAGHSPVETFQTMWQYLDSADSLVAIINRAVPYYVAGVAVAIGFKMGLFNIGADGQYRLAALIAAAAGAAVSLPAPLHVAFILLVAVAVGGAWAAVAGVLKVTRGVNEVVSTIMLNFIATGISAFLLAEYFRDNNASLVAQTERLPRSAWVPSLNRLLETFGYHLPQGTILQGFLVGAIIVGIGYYVVVWRTRFGFELRTTGVNAAAARSAGVNPKAMILKAIVLSGMVAGLIGMAPLLCDPELHQYADTFPTAIGFTGIAIALLGRNSPGGIAVAAFVWAALERAGQALPPIGVPQEIVKILQGTLLLTAVIAFEVVRRFASAAQVREAATQSGSRASSTPVAVAAS